MCEANGIHLSHYGNHTSKELLVPLEVYKKEHKLFDVARIQRAFKYLDAIILDVSTIAEGSISLKYILEKYQGEPITTGDCIAVMLLNGYAANFVPKIPSYPKQLRVNCKFYIDTHM